MNGEVCRSFYQRTVPYAGMPMRVGVLNVASISVPAWGRSINADLNGARNILHIPESLGSVSWGQLTVRDRGNGLKTQPMVYRWTSRAGWVQTTPTSNEAIRMKAVNHKPMNRPKGTPTLKDGEEVSLRRVLC